jgi:hypothetical protein
MKHVLLCLSFLAVPGFVLAQKAFILSYQPKNGFVHMAAGSSLPLGSFGDQCVTTAGAGLALPGLSLQFSAGYRLAGPVGLMVRVEQSQMALQTANLAERVISEDSTYNRQATAGAWQTTSLLAGPYLRIPLGRFSVDLRVLAGQVRAVCPMVNLTGEVGEDELVSVITPQATATATATSFGLSVSYRLGRSLAFQVNGDYNRADVAFPGMTSRWQQGARSQDVQFDSRQRMNTLSLSAGLSILFGNRKRVF